jgi:5-methyltetrahydrofolate--homocysteine methyltransferase
MDDLLKRVALCIEKGKANKDAPYPPDMKGEDGASELTQQALEQSISPNDILQKALMVGMHNIGEKFSRGEAFIPELLISAKAMNAAMEHLKPYFESGEATHRGTVVIGTVSGDLHDIGKNIVRMVLEGAGWQVVDLGVDVSTEKFVGAVAEDPARIVGLSALLTTTMVHMEDTVKQIKQKHPQTQVYIGGAPVSHEFNDKIGADGYFPDPHSFVKHLTTNLT